MSKLAPVCRSGHERPAQLAASTNRIMKQDYSDITDKLGKPLWWDEAGCPRYEPFQPCMANDFYAHEVALLRVACQNCHAEHIVCVSSGHKDKRPFANRPQPLAYGDPPRGCCQVGASMTSETIEVLEMWTYKDGKWVMVGRTSLPDYYARLLRRQPEPAQDPQQFWEAEKAEKGESGLAKLMQECPHPIPPPKRHRLKSRSTKRQPRRKTSG